MRALLDTNAVIYLQKGLLVDSLPQGEYFISVITELELLSFHGLNQGQQAWLEEFLSDIRIIGLSTEVKQQAVFLRRMNRLKLPDAIVAASAIVLDATLITSDHQLMALRDIRTQKVELLQK